MRALRRHSVLAAFALTAAAPLLGQLSPAHDGPPGGAYNGDFVRDADAVARLSALGGRAACTGGRVAGMFDCRNIDLESFVSLGDLVPGSTSVSNLWGFVDLDDRREYAVVGVDNGTSIVDVTDAVNPRVVGAVPGPASVWREVKVYQAWNETLRRHDAYAYVVSEAATAGLQIIDLSDLPASVSLVATFRGFDTAHTLFVANVDPSSGAANVPGVAPVLYIEGSNEGFLALDISRPETPAILGRLLDSYVHDVWAGVFRGSRASACGPGHDPCELVVDFGGDAVRMVDFTAKADPVVLAELRYDGIGYAHSGWISRDGNHVFAFDEADEREGGGKSRIRVLDISDLAHPRVAAVWTSTTDAIEHNGYVVGDKLYVSYYEHGMTVLDVSQPTAPREIGFFDTFPTSDAAEFHGAWGVYPFLPSGSLLVSNIDGAGGLFVLKESAAGLAPPPDVPREPIEPVEPRTRGTRLLPGAR